MRALLNKTIDIILLPKCAQSAEKGFQIVLNQLSAAFYDALFPEAKKRKSTALLD